ncbi:DUF6671 family protein [Fictibacillus iocasae]|uniref:DUF6671 family protein n=1 Tax=Fictibacillus iocasae TaxID=2715437 RepID=A0ABW2NPR3_9BACL
MEIKEVIANFFGKRMATLATMHQKEKVMSPLLEKHLRVRVHVPTQLNTDTFGTFTRDVDRMGNQLEAARHKAQHALSLTGHTIAIASEGLFGPHPLVPWVGYNRELVLLIDVENQFEIIGESMTTDTNLKSLQIKNIEDAHRFCEKVGFPEHAVIVRNNNEWIKGITSKKELEQAFERLMKSADKDFSIETDMRAMFNPTRMKYIEAATQNLIDKIYSLCSKCSYPGFEVVERKKGLLCRECGLKTPLIIADVYRCKKCGHCEEKLYPKGKTFADPVNCLFCNP